MSKSKTILLVILSVVVVGGACFFGFNQLFPNKETNEQADAPKLNGVQYISKTDAQSFYVMEGNEWKRMFVKGVNIGAGKPGAFPGEVAITYEEYYRWFGYISEMNANTIRVYTTQRPQFYNALYDFNQAAEKAGKPPIYVIHGVWVNEEDILTIDDAYGSDDKILNDVVKSGEEIVDIIHGNAYLPVHKGYADGTYTTDISKYVTGWILGIEWDPSFVIGTNENNPKRNHYEGQYLYTEGASPFETFLAELGDRIIEYETKNYNMQRPVAFSNWVTTDPLTHPNEPYKNEDMVEVNVEHVKSHDAFKPGMFASYHVYPYYPDSFSYQTDYITYKDEEGKPNPYRAYLEDIKKVHTMPIVISEFGIPSSRGKTHENKVTGFNQGYIDEKTQGDMIVHMMNDIHDANLAGGLVFTWQDEWFKRTWNNSDLDLSDSRPLWSNTQTSEQHFGLLAFDPGTDKTIRTVDGNVDDWKGDKPIYSQDGLDLYVASDEAYVYLRVDAANFDFNQDTLLIPFDTIDGQGNNALKQYGTTFSRPADFVLKVHGQTDSHLLVDAYYDNYYFRYGILTKLIEKNEAFQQKNSGIFNPIRLALNKSAIQIPGTDEHMLFDDYETGLLTYGNANPDSKDYYSLSDFYYDQGHLEIRLPWQLFNVMDPAKRLVIDDMYARGKISATKVDAFHIGAELVKNGEVQGQHNVSMEPYSWDEWEMPTFHERLKPSYYIVKQGFLGVEARK
ncbi:family 2 glycosyl transferase [Paenibacillus sp. PR3]|uniref:Family 2 glycosyl transferase n=1 Tax=Paenibacillus terricola TaxID=2763503 RepID=A0ABR8N196_9BACL|nr:family 2 glycosyl transferase [Paenibacillus terricola]MBD3921950.1 family 2 glycosyl transferase [Paenibacillus terricola]